MSIDDDVRSQQERAISMMVFHLEQGLTISQFQCINWCHMSGGLTHFAALFGGSVRPLI